MKKFASLVLIGLLFMAIPSAFAQTNNHQFDQRYLSDGEQQSRHKNQQQEFEQLKAQYFSRAQNNEIYLLPQDFRFTTTYTYHIKEFKNGFQRGQRLVGNMGTDQEYFLRVVDITDETAIALLETGNPNDIQRYDRMLISNFDIPAWMN